MSKNYKTGYVQGTFDLFHIGHLNLLRRAKTQCEYLIVGVVTDRLNMLYKGKYPFIEYADRAEIVAAVKYTDKVIKVDIGSDDKLAIWEKYHYDCHFSGDDHDGECDELTKELRKHGSDMKFFPYTQKTSSTKIKSDLRDKIFYGLAAKFSCDKLPNKIALYGAGRLGQSLRAKIADTDHKEITVWVDKNYKVLQKKGLYVQAPKLLNETEFDVVLIAVLNKKTANEIKAGLIKQGITAEKVILVNIDVTDNGV